MGPCEARAPCFSTPGAPHGRGWGVAPVPGTLSSKETAQQHFLRNTDSKWYLKQASDRASVRRDRENSSSSLKGDSDWCMSVSIYATNLLLPGKYLNTVKVYPKGLGETPTRNQSIPIHLSCKTETGASIPKNSGRDYTSLLLSIQPHFSKEFGNLLQHFVLLSVHKLMEKKALKAHFHISQFNSLKQFVNSTRDFSVSIFISKCIVLAMLQSSWTDPEQSAHKFSVKASAILIPFLFL